MKTRIKYTTTILTNHNGKPTPLILTLTNNPKFFKLPIIYLNYLRRQKTNLESLKARSRSIALIYDFYLHTNPTTIADQRKFIESLIKALKTRSTLNWDVYSKNKITQHINFITNYINWVIKHPKLTTKDESHFTKTLQIGINFSKQLPNSLYFPKRIKVPIESITPKIKKSFPVNQIVNLLKVSQSPQEQLMYMLLAFGGRKLCELLLMLTDDINIKNEKIIIAHPTKSLIKNQTREEYLNDLNLIPRIYEENDLLTGWSRTRFQYPERLESEVVLIGSMKEYFWNTMSNYLKWRKQFKSNPYLFVDRQGNPLRHETFFKWFYKRCKRLKIFGSKEGVSTLGLRNFYAYYLTRGLEVDKVIVQRLMGYTKISSVDQFLINNNWEKVYELFVEILFFKFKE